jgi:hypothetical protein
MNHYQSSQINYCSNCGKPVDSGSIYCENCGTQLDLFTDLNRSIESDHTPYINQARSDGDTLTESTLLIKRKIGSKWKIFIPLVVLFFISVIIILTQNSSRSNKNNAIFYPSQPSHSQDLSTIPTEKPLPTIPTEESVSANPTKKPVSTIASEKPTSTITPTEFKCPGMPASRVKVGDKVVVCSIERLIMRDNHNLGSKIVRYFNPGTKGEIIDGPECADQSTWWKVRINYNNRLYEGWMKEGTDPKAKYYLCLDDEDS